MKQTSFGIESKGDCDFGGIFLNKFTCFLNIFLSFMFLYNFNQGSILLLAISGAFKHISCFFKIYIFKKCICVFITPSIYTYMSPF